MGTYLIKLKSGLSCELRADDEKDLYRKINSGHYGILSIRSLNRVIITEKNIAEIVEQNTV